MKTRATIVSACLAWRWIVRTGLARRVLRNITVMLRQLTADLGGSRTRVRRRGPFGSFVPENIA